MIDPLVWAMTPGMGRAPNVAAPTPVTDPAADLARRLLRVGTGGDNRVMPGDRPVGALVRDPETLTQAQQIEEMHALGGFPHEGRAAWTRGPAAAVTGMATLAGTGGAGLPAGWMAGKGVEQQQQRLANALTQGIAGAYERGMQESGTHQQAIAQRARTAPTMADAYEAGRQAARGYRPEREQRGGGDLSGGRGGLGSGNVSRGAGSDTLSGGRF